MCTTKIALFEIDDLYDCDLKCEDYKEYYYIFGTYEELLEESDIDNGYICRKNIEGIYGIFESDFKDFFANNLYLKNIKNIDDLVDMVNNNKMTHEIKNALTLILDKEDYFYVRYYEDDFYIELCECDFLDPYENYYKYFKDFNMYKYNEELEGILIKLEDNSLKIIRETDEEFDKYFKKVDIVFVNKNDGHLLPKQYKRLFFVEVNDSFNYEKEYKNRIERIFEVVNPQKGKEFLLLTKDKRTEECRYVAKFISKEKADDVIKEKGMYKQYY